MRDIKYDEAHVIALTGGDYDTVDGINAVRQDVAICLSVWLGEWFLDTRIGFPWLSVFEKTLTAESATTYFQRAILNRDGVESVEKFSIEVDSEREASVSFEAKSNLDDLPIIFDKEFILNR